MDTSQSTPFTSGNPLSSQADDDNLCSMMKDLLVTGLSTREDMLALGFTEDELNAAGGASVAEKTATPPSSPHNRAGVLHWTPQLAPTPSAFERSPAIPDPATVRSHQRRVRGRDGECVSFGNGLEDEESERTVRAPADSEDATIEGHPMPREPMTEAKRVERQRDARQAQQFSDSLAKANGAVGRTLFHGEAGQDVASAPSTPSSLAKPNSALQFTVGDAVAAKAISELLAQQSPTTADTRSFDDFMAERAMLCEECM